MRLISAPELVGILPSMPEILSVVIISLLDAGFTRSGSGAVLV